MADCGLGSPVQHLERNGCLSDNLLAVHANYLAPGDAALLGRRSVSVVHCPRSHTFFQHRRFPRKELARARVNICLGTDSLASVTKARGQAPELNLFAEMQAFAASHPDVPSEVILQMTTDRKSTRLNSSHLVISYAVFCLKKKKKKKKKNNTKDTKKDNRWMT